MFTPAGALEDGNGIEGGGRGDVAGFGNESVLVLLLPPTCGCPFVMVAVAGTLPCSSDEDKGIQVMGCSWTGAKDNDLVDGVSIACVTCPSLFSSICIPASMNGLVDKRNSSDDTGDYSNYNSNA